MNFKSSNVIAAFVLISVVLISACGNNDGKQIDAAQNNLSVVTKAGTDIDFSKNPFPPEVASASGFSDPETWGRWTDGDKAVLTFNNPLPENFELVMVVHAAFGPSANRPLKVKAGNSEQSFTVSTPDQTISIPFRLEGEAKSLEIKLPNANSPKSVGISEDTRKLGIGISKLSIVPGK